MEKIVLKIDDLACPDCAAKIGEVLRRKNGVAHAEVDFMSGKLNLSYDPQVISLDEINKTVAKLGYEAK